MTQTERQILELIEADPMISQEQLAKTLGITRSSAAAHISNLMKNGYIAGKGYVLNQGHYVVVVGGVNVDIGGRPFTPLTAQDSNPGKVTTSLGGVGRNIAHNISLMGLNSHLLTAFGDDVYAQKIIDSCTALNIDISHALKVSDGTTPVYLFINDYDGDMALAVSDMSICDKITPAYLNANLQTINNAQLVVADTNIPEESIVWLSENCTVPLFTDPVSTKKAVKLKNVLGKFHTIKPNRIEAELLSGIAIHDNESLYTAAKVLLDKGLERVFISLGTKGVLAADHNEMLICPCYPAVMKNATGAGDAFMAALVRAYTEELDLSETAKFASAAAALAVESMETINPSMSIETIRKKISENSIEIQKITEP